MSLPIWSKYGRIYSINNEIAQQRGDYDSLCLTEREIGSFSKIMIDKFHFYSKKEKNSNNSNSLVDINRIIIKLKLNPIPFYYRLFGMFDITQSGMISFHDLLLLIWNICTIDILSLGYLLFDIYDLDRSGTFEFQEVKLLLNELCDGTELNSDDIQLVTEHLDKLNYLSVSSEVFAGLCRSHPVILRPLKIVQTHLKNFFPISKDFWINQLENRGRMTDREYIPIQQLIELQASRLGITRQWSIDITHTVESSADRDRGAILTAVRDVTTSSRPTPLSSSIKLPPVQVISYTDHCPSKRTASARSISLSSSSTLGRSTIPPVTLSPSLRDYIADLSCIIRSHQSKSKTQTHHPQTTLTSTPHLSQSSSGPTLDHHTHGIAYRNSWR